MPHTLERSTSSKTRALTGALTHYARDTSPTTRSAVLQIPTCITVASLVRCVRAAWVAEQLPHQLSSELWPFASKQWPAVCNLRVRDDGDMPLFSDAVDGSTTGDELYPSDVLCARDALKCVNALEHIRGVPTTHQAILHHGISLADAVLAVLRKINTAPRVPGKPSLILALARNFDTEHDTPVLNAFTAALHPQAADGRRALSQALTWRHRRTLSQVALQFYVHLLQPRGAYIEVSHYRETTTST